VIEEKMRYRMDYENFEALTQKGAKMVIISNPHNPVGRVWSRDELLRLGEICLKYNLLIISDEIHSDLIIKPNKHIPFANLSNELKMNTVTFASTSKTFNLAGLFTGHVIIPNGELLKKYNYALEATGAGSGNIFGFESVKAAYSNNGELWLEEALEYIKGNADAVKSFFNAKMPKVKVADLQGTYLLWLDFRAFELDDDTLNNILINEAGVGLNRGSVFGDRGKCFMRMNLACSRTIVNEVLERIYKAFRNR
jgi:cystathionine beta-lyase